MMKGTYVFAGNRAFVLEQMLKLGLNIKEIWAVKGSYLQRYLDNKNMKYSLIENKADFLKDVEMTDFDFFISNGLPIILPAEHLRDIRKKFINIHPSLLPELRGRDPVPGALLFQKDSGATCHLMDEGIDTGPVISQIRIENTEDLEAGLLYQLSFMAEGEVFKMAYEREFMPMGVQDFAGRGSYYSFQKDDLRIDLEREDAKEIIAKVKAFASKSKGAFFEYAGRVYKCSNAQMIKNPYLLKKMDDEKNHSFVMMYEDKMIYKTDGEYIKLTVTADEGKSV